MAKGLLAILGAPKGGEEEETEEDDMADVEESAFKDFSAALKSGDSKAGIEAFKRLYEACQSAPPMEEDDEGLEDEEAEEY